MPPRKAPPGCPFTEKVAPSSGKGVTYRAPGADAVAGSEPARLAKSKAETAAAASKILRITRPPKAERMPRKRTAQTGQTCARRDGTCHGRSPVVRHQDEDAHENAGHEHEEHRGPEPVDPGDLRGLDRRPRGPPSAERADTVGVAGVEGPVVDRAVRLPGGQRVGHVAAHSHRRHHRLATR